MAKGRKAAHRAVPNVRNYVSGRVYNGIRVKTGQEADEQVTRTRQANSQASKRRLAHA